MSKDFFKVKRGLNIKPQDPSELSDLQDGDIIVDSTDDNKLKVYDSVGGDFASVGTGGSSGNILKDIEKLTPVTSNVVAAQETTTFLPIDDNNKSVKATFSGSDGSIRYEAAASADLDGVQGVVIVWIKTTLDNLTVSSTVDGVVQSSKAVSFSNKWRQYQIPVVFTDANYGFQISADGAAAGDVFIDEAFVRVDSNLVTTISDVDTDWVNYTPTFTGFGTVSSFNARYKRVGDSLILSVKFTAGTPTATEARISLPSGLVISQNVDVNTSVADVERGSVTGNQNYINISPNEDYVTITLKNSGSGGLVDADGNVLIGAGQDFSFTTTQIPIQGWATGRTEATNQQTELTAATANSLNAKFASNGANVSEDYDWISSSTRTTTGRYTLNFNSGVFNVNPACQVTNQNTVVNGSTDCKMFGEPSTSSMVVYCAAASGAAVDRPFHVQCDKQGTDVNKSQTIVGKFEQIEEVTADKTIATDNTFTAVVTETGVVTGENYDWIDGNCSDSGTLTTCNFTTEMQQALSEPMNCYFTEFSGTSTPVATRVTNTTTSFVRVETSRRGVLTCIKTGADYNKSFTGAVINASDSAQTIADIVRQDIVSSELCQVIASGNDGESISGGTEDIPWKTKTKDNCNAWSNGGNTGNNTNDQYTAQKNGLVLFSGSVRTNSGDSYTIESYVNGVRNEQHLNKLTGFASESFQALLNLQEGDTVSFRFTSGNGRTLSTTDQEIRHYLTITELPDNAAVLESLNQNPRLQLDQYSESEIEWGKWNGEQLYRRCFTVDSDITAAGSTTITTWDTNLKAKNLIKETSNRYIFQMNTVQGTSNSRNQIRYVSSSGVVEAVLDGGSTILADTSFCMDYTK